MGAMTSREGGACDWCRAGREGQLKFGSGKHPGESQAEPAH